MKQHYYQTAWEEHKYNVHVHVFVYVSWFYMYMYMSQTLHLSSFFESMVTVYPWGFISVNGIAIAVMKVCILYITLTFYVCVIQYLTTISCYRHASQLTNNARCVHFCWQGAGFSMYMACTHTHTGVRVPVTWAMSPDNWFDERVITPCWEVISWALHLFLR